MPGKSPSSNKLTCFDLSVSFISTISSSTDYNVLRISLDKSRVVISSELQHLGLSDSGGDLLFASLVARVGEVHTGLEIFMGTFAQGVCDLRRDISGSLGFSHSFEQTTASHLHSERSYLKMVFILFSHDLFKSRF